MSFITTSWDDYLWLNDTLPSVGPDDWKLMVAWVYIPTGQSLGSVNVISDLSSSDGSYIQANFTSARVLQLKGKVDGSQSTTSVSSGYTIPFDTWTLTAVACGPDDGTTRQMRVYANDPAVNSGGANANSSNTMTANWSRLIIGNERTLSNFRDTNANTAAVAVYNFGPSSDFASIEAVVSDLYNGGTFKAPNNTTETPVFYTKLASDATVEIGPTLTSVGTPVFNSGLNPTLLEPSPINPSFDGNGAHVVAVSIGETSVTARATITWPEGDAGPVTVQAVVNAAGTYANEAAAIADVATFQGSAFSANASKEIQFDIPVTGLTGSTNYDIWLRAVAVAGGTDDWSTTSFTTTPAAPTITSVNGGNPIPRSATSVNVTGSGLTGHTACDIDGTAQSAFSVTNDTTATFNAVMPVGRKYGDNAMLNIGGTNHTVTFENDAGWNNVAITNLWPTKADRIDAGQSWSLANNDVVDWEITANNVVVDNTGRVSADATTAFDARVFDDSDQTWGSQATYTANASLTPVTKDFSVVFSVMETITRDFGVSFNVLESITKDYSLSFNVATAVTKDFNLSFNVAEAVTVDFAVSFNVANYVFNTPISRVIIV